MNCGPVCGRSRSTVTRVPADPGLLQGAASLTDGLRQFFAGDALFAPDKPGRADRPYLAAVKALDQVVDGVGLKAI